ncbi:MAG: adenosylcobinamide-GDP ribazoletransferase [Candidatus Syntropharchaeia archaeon]
MSSLIRGIRDNISFFTILPAKSVDLENAAKNAHLLPFISLIIASISYIFAFFAFYFLPSLVAGFLTLFFILFLTGFHHIDGLCDFADGMMTTGDSKRKRKAMRDLNTGTGGIITGIFFIAICGVCIAEIGNFLFVGILLCDLSNKLGILSISTISRPSYPGMGGIYIKNVDEKAFLIGLGIMIVFCIISGYLTDPSKIPLFLGSIFVSIPVSFYLRHVAERSFGGVSGDVIGACGEISRLLTLIVLSGGS